MQRIIRDKFAAGKQLWRGWFAQHGSVNLGDSYHSKFFPTYANGR